ncbi:ABC transporter ATP-binding protein [Haloplanus pelagicus]|jgi:ABC-2 type transport system ATP-binding protein|uniref:ABC transporter ATP-binding protein n=1 Tax=Haloplanus pelagicus TaxID=2949995 RepID=UPI0020419811|nr:ABC transporter ATP-binding protein [Haloplanus sp. HW8-1]
MAEAEVLVADDVRKQYGDAVALDGVSLSIPTGEVFGLVGPNGAGKTTLVRALTGTTRCEGTVRVLGVAPGNVDAARVGLLPQSFRPADRLTARELIAYYAGLYDDARSVEAVLCDVGLSDDADTWYQNLSGGQQRRACVGTALVNDPDVLFLDEPTTGIDPAGRRSLWTLIDDLAAGGTTVLLTSHSMAEVERLADRVGLLRTGRLVAVGTPAALIAEHGGDSHLLVDATRPVDRDALSTALGAEVAERDGRLVVRDVALADVGDVVATLEAEGVDVDSFTWAEPGLEDVYLRLTGESIAPADATGPATPTETEGER